MLKSFFASRSWAAWAWGGLAILLISVGLQVEVLVKLNSWYKDFYDLLSDAQNHEVAEFWTLIASFLSLAFLYISLATFSSFFARHYTFRWRQAMTFAYIPLWSIIDQEIEGSSQRIQEDTKEFAEIVESLGLELFESILKVIAFVAILWTLSESVSVPLLKNLEGSLVYVAIGLSFGGILISFLVGIKLPGLHYNNQRVEARFRKQLVYGEDNKVYAQQPSLEELFVGVRFNYFRLFLHYCYFDIWRISYLQMAIIVPYLMVGPSMFTGAITLGFLQQAANAFGNVNDSFSYLIRSWPIITKLLSIFKRLNEFETAIGYRKTTRSTNLPPVEPVIKL